MKRDDIRSMLSVQILETFLSRGLSIEEAEKHLCRMNDEGEIGMRVDLIFNALSLPDKQQKN